MGVVSSLWRAVAVFRVSALGYAAYMTAQGFRGYERPDLGWAVMGGVEGRYRRGLLLLDAIGTQIVNDVSGSPRVVSFQREFPRQSIDGDLRVGEYDVHTRLTQWMVDVKLGFRALSLPMSRLGGAPESPEDRRRFDVDLLAGFRYWNVTNKTSLEIEPGSSELTSFGSPPAAVTFS